jgi:hypothetical protein
MKGPTQHTAPVEVDELCGGLRGAISLREVVLQLLGVYSLWISRISFEFSPYNGIAFRHHHETTEGVTR